MPGVNIFNSGDPLLGNTAQSIEHYKALLQHLEAQQNSTVAQQRLSHNPIWDNIDSEINSLTDNQRAILAQNEDYANSEMEIQSAVQHMMLAMIKPKIEQSEQGKNLLSKHLDLIKKLKKGVVDTTNKKMQEFEAWQAFAEKNPNATYNDFINSITK